MDYVLVVDDSLVARMLITQGLEETYGSVEVVQAKSAEDAIERLEREDGPPVLSIIDYNMPGMDGLELAEWLENRHPGCKKVLCTANVQENLARRASELGVPVAAKPFTMEGLQAVIEVPLAPR